MKRRANKGKDYAPTINLADAHAIRNKKKRQLIVHEKKTHVKK